MSKRFEHLCKPFNIGKLKIRNRFAVAPMGVGFYENIPTAEFTQDGIEYWVQRAKGGFGLIYMGATSADYEIDPTNDLTSYPLTNPALFRKSVLPLNDRVQAFGSHAFMQITAGIGRTYADVYSPSAIPVSPLFAPAGAIAPALSKEQIKKKIDYVVRTAELCKRSGFSGVEVHSIHWGYLLDQFVMSLTNKREDEYGGSLENRMRIVREIYEGVRQVCGDDYPITIRAGLKSYLKALNVASFTGEEEAGRTVEEAVKICKMLEEYGFDALSMDAGTTDSFYWACPPSYIERGYAIEACAAVKNAVKIPVMLGGRMGDPFMCEQAIREGKLDAVVLGRPSLADPDFPLKVMMGRPERIRPCIACNQGCLHHLLSIRDFSRCAVNPELGKSMAYQTSLATEKKKVVVVGGGVAGMEAARTAAIRGHQVDLYEKGGELGGNLLTAGAHDFKREILELNEWYKREMTRRGVRVHLNRALDAEKILALEPDIVTLAVGSEPIMPNIPGIDHDKTVTALDVLTRKVQVGQKVVVVGGGLVGCEMAMECVNQGKEVVLVEALDAIMSSGEAVPLPNRMYVRDFFEHHRTDVRTGWKIAVVNDAGAVIARVADGEEQTIAADTVIIAVGFRPLPSIVGDLYETGIEVYEVGDGKKVVNIMNAINDAHEVARLF